MLALVGLALLSAVIASVLGFHASGAQAASGSSFTAHQMTLTRLGSGRTIPQGVQLNVPAFACSNMTDLPIPAGCDAAGDDGGANLPNGNRPLPNAPFNGHATAKGKNAPNVPDTGRAGAGSQVGNFNGINDDTNVPLIGGHVTPPDQGLCVGPASAFPAPLGVPGNTSIVIEAVNETWAVYDTSGNVLWGPDTLADLFSDPYSSGDVSCNYDPGTQSFFFTEIGAVFEGDNGFYGTGLVVLNANGYAAYGVDTASGGACFPDFPQFGFDDNALYITANEFCGPNQDQYGGTNLVALSKSQLAGLSNSVNATEWDLLSDDNGIPVLGLRPAIGDGTATEYLLNSVPYGADGNGTDSSSLGFWQVTGGANITSGSGPVTLTGHSIATEPYAFPVNATSTGDGSCSVYHGHCEITSETYLDPVDSRLLQVQFVNDHGATRLYASLDTALTVGGDSTPVDGAAWFDVNPNTGKVNHQGYVGVAGTNILFPSMVRSSSGTLNMGFSMTSPTLNPSTGYAVSKNEGNAFSPVQITGAGSGPHKSFSPIVYGRHRWGDYSAVALDPITGNVWMADEYIPPADQGGSDIADNWGTRVWGITG